MPTSATVTFTNDQLLPAFPSDPPVISVPMAPSLDLPAGTVLGLITADGVYAAYDDGNADGTEVARGILQHEVVTDASGKIAVEFGDTSGNAPMFLGGIFRAEDLTGMDAAALTDMGGRNPVGDLTTGIVIIPT